MTTRSTGKPLGAEVPRGPASPKQTPVTLRRLPSRLLRGRYLVALALVGTVLVGQYVALARQLSAAEHDAVVINRSGQQRMLSQRIALQAALATSTPAGPPRDATLAAVEDAGHRMRFNLGVLTEGDEAPARETSDLRALYFGRDALRSRQLALAAATEDPDPDELARLVTTADALLLDLDRAVSLHEDVARSRVARFQRLELAFLGLGLLLLALEMWLVFRPLERSLDGAFRELSETNDELSAFTYRVSHDLRAPLASARGLLQVAQETMEEGGGPEETDEAMRRSGAALARMDAVIGDLVALTRTRLTGRDEEPVPVVPSVVVEEAVAKVAHLAEKAGVAVTCHLASDERLVTRPILLQQVIDNLVSNAVKYRNPDTTAAWVRVAVLFERDACVFRIDDNGVGVPEPHREELFGAFKRFHPDVSFGTGLGLYLARRSAEALGGAIGYAPRHPGSTFTLRLPLGRGATVS